MFNVSYTYRTARREETEGQTQSLGLIKTGGHQYTFSHAVAAIRKDYIRAFSSGWWIPRKTFRLVRCH